ncbi:hypothetical protein TNCT_398271 [Trichonephila clavata]|uniref:Uncharacterized protein n=1 Tax=Trichonephila clavata TaxID=2740835 RepID=A0A8X6F4G0_TRICU|nr:hypothetical protein TNCT_398271 [Trichonephila clavata]
MLIDITGKYFFSCSFFSLPFHICCKTNSKLLKVVRETEFDAQSVSKTKRESWGHRSSARDHVTSINKWHGCRLAGAMQTRSNRRAVKQLNPGHEVREKRSRALKTRRKRIRGSMRLH